MSSKGKDDLWIEVLNKSGTVMVNVAGGSMSPALNVGNKVYVELSHRASYRIGDIVVFPVADSLMIHRIVSSLPTPKGKLFVHKGDKARVMAFGLVRQEQVLGKAVRVKRGSKEIPVSSLPQPGVIRLLSPLYSLLALERYVAIWLKKCLFRSLLLCHRIRT